MRFVQATGTTTPLSVSVTAVATWQQRALTCLAPPQVAIRIPVSVEQFGVSEYTATDSPGYEHAAVS